MKISAISAQIRNPDRVNVSIDGKYRLSLDIAQLVDLGVKVGKEIDDQELEFLLVESQFGRLYSMALEYCLMRPHSVYEVRNYLWRKTLTAFRRNRQGQVVEKPGFAKSVADRVLARLIDRGYVDDAKFAKWWVENRNLRTGVSQRKLRAELSSKAVDGDIITEALASSERDEISELRKIIDKKRSKYADEQKLIQYLAGRGFSYGDIKDALEGS